MSTTARVNTRRNNQPPSCVLDNNNSEAPDALQQQAAAGDRPMGSKRPELHPLLLSPEEWKRLEKLGDILKEFTNVTLQMSKLPTLPWVLPMYEPMLTLASPSESRRRLAWTSAM